MKATPEQLRALWASIPGVNFNPPRSTPEPQPEPTPSTPKSIETHTAIGKQRMHPVGHPGEDYYTAEEAIQILQISRPYLSTLAKVNGIYRTCRQIAPLYTPRVFYLRKDIDALKQLRADQKQQPSRSRKYECGHPGSKYYTSLQAKDLLQITSYLLNYFTQKLNLKTKQRLIKKPNGQYIYPPQIFYLKEEIRELNNKIRNI